jgi:hypothetical protein
MSERSGAIATDPLIAVDISIDPNDLMQQLIRLFA